MPSLDSLQKTLASYKPVLNNHQMLKNVLIMYVMAEPQLPDQDCIESIMLDLQPEFLFNIQTLKGPRILHRILYQFLQVKGVTFDRAINGDDILDNLIPFFISDLPQRETARMNVEMFKRFQGLDKLNKEEQLRLTNSDFEDNKDEDDKKDEDDQTETKNDKPDKRETDKKKIDVKPDYGQDQRKANNMSNRFRKDDKFTGKLEETISEAIASYNEAAVDYSLNDSQKLQFFHLLFGGEAIRHYRNNVAHAVKKFDEACEMMKKEYNSKTRQNRVRKMLQGLRLTQIMEKSNIPVNEALEKLKETISRHAPNGPENYRDDQSLKEYLENAVVGLSWARNALMQSEAETGWTFNKLYTSLDAAYLQSQREEEANKRDGKKEPDKEESAKIIEEKKEVPSINYEGQSTYGRPRNPRSSSSRPFSGSSSSRPFKFTRQWKKEKRCFNCGSKDHLIRNCPKEERNVHHIIEEMLNSGNSEKIIYQMCCYLQDIIENESDTSDSDNSDNSDAKEHYVDSCYVDPEDF